MADLHRPDARIWWDRLGEGSPVLLLPGFGDSAETLRPLLPALSERHQVILMDPRGAGRSSVPDKQFSVRDLARDARAVLQAAGVERAHVIGFSMGGLIAQHLAIESPDEVRSLTLACTTPGGRHAAPMSRRVARLMHQPLAWASPARIAVMYAPTTAPFAIAADQHLRLAHPTSPAGYARQVMAMARYAGTLPRLASVACPTLVLHGTKDLIVPVRNAELIASAIPHAHLVKVTGAAHMLLIDAPRQVTGRIGSFLDEVDHHDMMGRSA